MFYALTLFFRLSLTPFVLCVLSNSVPQAFPHIMCIVLSLTICYSDFSLHFLYYAFSLTLFFRFSRTLCVLCFLSQFVTRAFPHTMCITLPSCFVSQAFPDTLCITLPSCFVSQAFLDTLCITLPSCLSLIHI